MDYVDELNDRIQERYRISDDMERLGIDDYEEYLDYLADLREEAQIRNYEMLQELNDEY